MAGKIGAVLLSSVLILASCARQEIKIVSVGENVVRYEIGGEVVARWLEDGREAEIYARWLGFRYRIMEGR